MTTTYKILICLVSAAAIAGGFFALGFMARGAGETGAAPAAKPKPASVWYCPMHPDVVRDHPDKCPKCFMDLVERKPGEDAGPRTLVMSESEAKLAEVATARVERKFVSGRIHLVGKVDYDETRVKTISAWVPGRLDRLFVDYTGVPVREGDHLVEMYSPDFLTAQEELVEARKQVDAAQPNSSEFLRKSNERALASSREKLRLWGLTAEQIQAIESSGEVAERVQINSPITGIVIHKNLNEGDYVKTGSRIYQVADLSHLWVQLDAYESDLPYIHYGQEVSIQAESYPGREFQGWVSFIDPVLNQRTRTVRVRVNVENPEGLLKPGMFVRTRIVSRPGHGGGGIAPRFRGKWICPMHPEVVEDAAGKCRVCGMNLVEAEKLGKPIAPDPGAMPLVVPVTAALLTGRRAVVYVRVRGTEKPTFEGREVVLGPRAGDYYQVVAGLREGEEVVVHGNFKIDSALQILAKPSMMSMPADPGPLQGMELLPFRQRLEPIYRAYFAVQVALAGDDAAATATPYRELETALTGLAEASEALPHRQARTAWAGIRTGLLQAVEAARAATGIEAARTAFRTVATRMVGLERTFGHSRSEVHTEVFCPMAFGDQGAAWLQVDGDVANPYFGSAMLRCGVVEHTYPGRGGAGDRTGGGPGKVDDEGAPGKGSGKAPGDAKPGDAKPGPVKPGPVKPGPVKPGPVKPGDAKPGDAKPGPVKPGTAQPDAGKAPALHATLQPLWSAYLSAQQALAGDDLAAAKRAFADLSTRAAAVAESVAGPAGREILATRRDELRAAATRGAGAADLAGARAAFLDASAAVLAIEERFGHGGGATYYEVFCPMAFDNAGASWLQATEQVANPYFGARMPRCGTVKRRHPPAKER